jgi:hypothetical protein
MILFVLENNNIKITNSLTGGINIIPLMGCSIKKLNKDVFQIVSPADRRFHVYKYLDVSIPDSSLYSTIDSFINALNEYLGLTSGKKIIDYNINGANSGALDISGADGQIIRINSDTDSAFTGIVANGSPLCSYKQADGKIIIATTDASSTIYNKRAVGSLFRINADYTLDTTFNAAGTDYRSDRISCLNGFINPVDGHEMLIVVTDMTQDTITIIDLNTNTIKTTLNFNHRTTIDVGRISGAIYIPSIDMILITGQFDIGNCDPINQTDVSLNGLALWNYTQSFSQTVLDPATGFMPVFSASAYIYDVLVESDGNGNESLVIGGTFTTVGGLSRTGIVRLSTIDAVDTASFVNVNSPAIGKITPLSGGGYLLNPISNTPAAFTYNGNTCNLAVRVNSAGVFVNTFLVTGSTKSISETISLTDNTYVYSFINGRVGSTNNYRSYFRHTLAGVETEYTTPLIHNSSSNLSQPARNFYLIGNNIVSTQGPSNVVFGAIGYIWTVDKVTGVAKGVSFYPTSKPGIFNITSLTTNGLSPKTTIVPG